MKTNSAEMSSFYSAIAPLFSDAGRWPVSFLLDGAPHRGLGDFPSAVSSRRSETDTVELVCAAALSGELELTAVATLYRDFPVAEWTLWLHNRSERRSGVISGLNAADMALAGADALLYRNTGDYYSKDGLETFAEPMPSGRALSFEPHGGRSCDQCLPFFRLCCEDHGYVLSVGWPGQWHADFVGEADGVRFTAKQADTDFYLEPGETLRTPTISLMRFDGGNERGINLWRSWFIAHILPKSLGKPIPTTFSLANGEGGEEFTLSTTENQLLAINTFIEKGCRPGIWWIDAGWYPCAGPDGVRHWPNTGDWRPDEARFPDGMESIGRLCEENGIDLLLWFEPERVRLAHRSPDITDDFLLFRRSRPDCDTAMLNLGNPKTLAWLVERVDAIIKKGKIKIYRQDCNFELLPYWRENDGEHRSGVCENLHIQGYLSYWDQLLERNPGLIIDSCASGGRRNDLEAMRRSVALHPTDYGYGNHPVKQLFRVAWFTWTPYFRATQCSWDDEDGYYDTGKPVRNGCDNFALMNSFAPLYSGAVEYTSPKADFDTMRRYNGIFDRVSHYMFDSDFYALTPLRRSEEDYFAIQFHNEETGRGLIQVIANTHVDGRGFTVRPRGLDRNRSYTFKALWSGESFVWNGGELSFSPEARSGELWEYSPAD